MHYTRDDILSRKSHSSTLLPPYFYARVNRHQIRRRKPTRRGSCLLTCLKSLFRTPSQSSPNLIGASLNIRSLNKRNANHFVFNCILSYSLDFFALSETWLRDGLPSNPSRVTSLPPNYVFLDKCRDGPHPSGGVALLCKSSLSPSIVSTPTYLSFEHITVRLSSPINLLVTVVYRPPQSNLQLFLSNFSDLLSALSLKSSSLLFLGDFNLTSSCPLGPEFIDLLSDFDQKQLVNVPTHNRGNTLDYVISNLNISHLNVFDQGNISDHFLIRFSIPSTAVPLPPPLSQSSKMSIKIRDIKSIDLADLSYDLNIALTSSNAFYSDDVNLVESVFSSCLTQCIDSHAPLVTRSVSARTNCIPFSPQLLSAKRARRLCERRLRRRPPFLSYDDALEAFNNASSHYFSLIENAYQNHNKSLVLNAKNKARALFNLFSSFTTNPQSHSSTLTAQQLADFFSLKILDIRNNLPSTVSSPLCLPQSPVLFTNFNQVDTNLVSSLISSSHKSMAPSDTFPPSLLACVSPTLVNYLAYLFNLSLRTGTFPDSYKHTHIRPIIKKLGLDCNSLSSYRPISQLPFLSKILERIVALQLTDHLISNNLEEPHSSAYRSMHSTESALLKVLSDIRISANAGKVTLLVLLDLSAAFDTIDHNILLNIMSNHLGISGTVLSWFRSYLSNRSTTVLFNKQSSSSHPVPYGVPQGSVLGPILFRIYLLPFCQLLHRLGLDFHLYADDTQLYIPFDVSSLAGSLSELSSMYSIISDWLSAHFLKLNDNKTEVILIGPKKRVQECKDIVSSVHLGSADIAFSSTVRDLGVLLDENLSMRPQILDVKKQCFRSLHAMSRIRSHFRFSDFETLIHAFVSSKIDYCNSLLVGAPRCDIVHLQRVQNYAARLLTFKRKRDPVDLISLHWLPVSQRIVFKILLFTYKCMNSLAPSYLSSLISLKSSCHSLRSVARGDLVIPDRSTTVKISNRTFGDRAFIVSAPSLWNSIPHDIRSSPSVTVFKKSLKTYLFRKLTDGC